MNTRPHMSVVFPTVLNILLGTILLSQTTHSLMASETNQPPRGFGAQIDPAARVQFPSADSVIDITAKPYLAVGDGQTDCTAVIQRALGDIMGKHKAIYFPAGVYLVSDTLSWSNKNADGSAAWGFNLIQGENATTTMIRLKPSTMTDITQPRAIMWCGGFGSADWFHNYVQDLTFDVGNGNPGAIGLQFYSNNFGAVRNCRFTAEPDSGLVGLDLAHRDMNGPLLVQNCEIHGFRRGISTALAVNSQTFEHLTLTEQTECGFDNAGQAVSVRSLVSKNSVPAVSTYGTFCLIDARLEGFGAASHVPAIVNSNGGRVYLRDVATSGYGRALGDVETPDRVVAFRIQGEDKPGSLGPIISEYSSHAPTRLFPSAGLSLRLPVKEPPHVPLDPPHKWANVDKFGADPTGVKDSSAAIQKAIDSGATTVFLPGSYTLKNTVVIRGKVRRLLGICGRVDYTGVTKPDFRIAGGDSPFVAIEGFAFIGGGVEIDTNRTVVLRSVGTGVRGTKKTQNADWFFEDIATCDVQIRKQNVWARQLNAENEGTHVLNDGGNLWVLGYKTERGGTLLETKAGGNSEVLGGFSYTTTAGKLAPMFVNHDSRVFTFFGEVCYTGDPFATLLRETRGQETKILERGAGSVTPYVGSPE